MQDAKKLIETVLGFTYILSVPVCLVRCVRTSTNVCQKSVGFIVILTLLEVAHGDSPVASNIDLDLVILN